MTYKKNTKNSVIYECINCDFTTSKKGDYQRHLQTQKHKNKNIVTYTLVLIRALHTRTLLIIMILMMLI